MKIKQLLVATGLAALTFAPTAAMPSPDPGGGSPGAVAYGDPDDGGGPALARGAALPGRDPGDGSPGVVANGDPDDGGQLPAVSDGDIRIGS